MFCGDGFVRYDKGVGDYETGERMDGCGGAGEGWIEGDVEGGGGCGENRRRLVHSG